MSTYLKLHLDNILNSNTYAYIEGYFKASVLLFTALCKKEIRIFL